MNQKFLNNDDFEVQVNLLQPATAEHVSSSLRSLQHERLSFLL